MGRIWRLTALAVAAALLGWAASALVGAQLCKIMSMEEIAMAPEASPAAESSEVLAETPPCQSPSCAKDDPSRPREEALAAAGGEDTTADTAPTASPGAKRRRARAARLRSSNAAAGDSFAQELVRGITKLGEHRYAIKSGTLEHALGNLRLLSRAVRVAPDVREGKPSGFRLVWVKAGGPIAKLGLRNGDVLVSVNGLDITTPDHALDAYSKLKAARRLVLGVVREGQGATLEYVIR